MTNDMYSPCFECLNRYGHSYTEACDDMCEYAYAVRKRHDHDIDDMSLIDRAIESARCRIYRLKHHDGCTLAHQKKAENQQELMKITIKALGFYRDSVATVVKQEDL